MRVLLAEAKALTREGLKRVTLQIDANCKFVEAADAATAQLAIVDPHFFDVAWFNAALFTAGESDLAASPATNAAARTWQLCRSCRDSANA